MFFNQDTKDANVLKISQASNDKQLNLKKQKNTNLDS
jgi:hypothetical protein